MKILYICHMTDLSGGTKALLNLIDIVSKDNQVYLLLPSNRGWLVEQLTKRNVKIFTAKYLLMWYSFHLSGFLTKGTIKNIYYYFRFKKSAERYVYHLLQKISPDIVHCNVGPLDISLTPCLQLNIPHVWHLREYQDKDFGCRMIYGKKHFINRLHTNGNFNIAITNGVFEHFQLRPCDRVIYDGPIDAARLSTNEDRQKIVLFVGNFLRAKQPDMAIRAFLLFHKSFPDYQMYLVGGWNDTDYVMECKHLISNNHADTFIKLLGRRTDVYDLMGISKILVVPSMFEGFGFITAEGMANGCAVIGRDTAGTKEQFDLGLKEIGSEIAYRFNTFEELVNCLKKAAVENTQLMRSNAKKVVLDNYTMEVHARNVMDFYHQILESYHARK